EEHPVSSAERWRRAGLHRLAHRVISVERDERQLTVRRRTAAAQSRAAVDVTERWTAVAGPEGPELRCEVTMVPNAVWDHVWPRLGIHLVLPDVGDARLDGASWFGLGPHDAYPDTAHSVHLGRFSADIEELTVDYARPQ